VQYLAWGNGIEQVNYCTRPTAEWNSSLDYFHHRRPNILNYCNHIHQITVLLHNHTFHEEIQHNLVWFSETISLIGFDWSLSHDYLPNVKCVMVTSRRKTIKALFLCYFYPALIVYIYIYVWKLNQTVLELDLWAVKFCSSLDGIWTHTIDTLQHQSLSLMSNALDLSTTSAILKYNFNSRSVTLSRQENLEIDIRHVSKRV
jgi:hypothetical protein